MTTTPAPFAAPVIIASLSIGIDPSPEVVEALVKTIRCHRAQFSYDDIESILTAAEKHDDHLQALIINALELDSLLND